MFLEIDDIIVEKTLWKRVLEGHESAKSQLRNELDDIQLYMHIFCFDEGLEYEWVTIRELHEERIIEFVRIEVYKD